MRPEVLAETIISCNRCELHRCRKKTVPGEGPCDAEVMMVGEAPGAEEDARGRPFVGRAGKVLDRALAAAGLDRSRVFITNVVKCRPPDNRRPKSKEMLACRPYLDEQIEIIKPEVICLLGNVPTYALLKRQGVTRLHGTVVKAQVTGGESPFPPSSPALSSARFLVTFHPAAILRNRNLEESFVSDLQKITEMLPD